MRDQTGINRATAIVDKDKLFREMREVYEQLRPLYEKFVIAGLFISLLIWAMPGAPRLATVSAVVFTLLLIDTRVREVERRTADVHRRFEALIAKMERAEEERLDVLTAVEKELYLSEKERRRARAQASKP